MAISICLLISLVIAWALLNPLLAPAAPDSYQEISATSSALNDQRERCVQVIKDLELDLATGKLTQEEYTRMRSSVGQELLGIVDKIEEIKS